MAGIVGLFPSALAAARRGSSFRAWEREVRSLGLGARSSEMNQLFRMATETVSRANDEIFAPQNAVPTDEYISSWPTRKATGYGQTVTLVYRDKITGHLNSTWYRTTATQPMTRGSVIDQAIAAYEGNAERYGQVLVGAAYTSTVRYEPMP